MLTASTRSVWLCSYFLANGLKFSRATRLVGRHFRVNFTLEDPAGVAPMLTRKFLEDVEMQRLISARRACAEVLDAVHARGQCDAIDVADALAAVDVAWRDTQRTARGPVSPRDDTVKEA